MRQASCAVFLLALAAAGAAHDLPPDVVAVSGRQLSRLLDTPPTAIIATRFDARGPAPAHVQIDQRARDADGRWQYAFETGEDARPPAHAGFGPDDLLLLATREGGERVHPAPLETTEVELGDTVFPHPTLSEMMHESVMDAYGRVIHT